MNYFIKFFKHLHTVNKHRFLVMKYCFKLGLYWQGLTHDLSKYSFTEFIPGVKYYSGVRSPIDAEKEEKGYSMAWLHHRGRNFHHWESFTDNYGPREVEEHKVYINDEGKEVSINTKSLRSNPDALEIPINYVLEMICDWLAAGQTYLGDKWTQEQPLEYYKKYEPHRLIHPETKKILENILIGIKNDGIDYTFIRIKKSFMSLVNPKVVTIGINSWKDYKKEHKFKKS